MAKTRTGGLEPDAAALTHNPFAKLAVGSPPGVSARPTAAAPLAQRQRPVEGSPAPARRLRVQLEARGRSGKVITRVIGLPKAGLELIAFRLRDGLGCPASVEGEDVVLEGSLADRASSWLQSVGDLSALVQEAVERPKLERKASLLAPAPPVHSTDPVISRGTSAGAAAGMERSKVRRGKRVAIVLKADQSSGDLTYGVVRDILTSSATHPRGIKVRLETGEVGRVKFVYE